MSGKKILVRGVNWLGDAVISTAALLRLREAHPASEIIVLTPAKLMDLWTNHPAINRALEFTPGESVWRVATKLKRERFDTAMVFPNSFRSAVEIWLADIPERIGYAGNLRTPLFTKAVPRPSEDIPMHKRSDREIKRLAGAKTPRKSFSSKAHHLHHYLRLTAEVGGNPEALAPSIAMGQSEMEAFRQKFLVEPGEAILSLNPGAEYGPAKRWPVESFIAAANIIQRDFHGTWLLLGGPNDFDICETIVRGLRAIVPGNRLLNLAGKTTLRELGAALAASRVLLTNDTGPMHLAAAVGTRVVAIFGSTSPELTAPGLPNENRHLLLFSDVGCAPCFRRTCPIDFRCMNQVAPQTVAHAVLQFLA